MTTLNNIHYDGLEPIFKELNIQEILNLSDTCQYLRQCTVEFYSRKFSSKIIDIDLASDPDWVKPGISETKPIIEIAGIKHALTFLRCFGKCLDNIRVAYSDIEKINNQISAYMQKYCSESLNTLSCSNINLIKLKVEMKPFLNVFECNFGSINFDNGLSTIAKLFPRIKKMSLSVFSFRNANVNFQNLEELNMWVEAHISETTSPTAKIIQANPQIECLILRSNQMSMKLLLNLLTPFSKVTKLHARNLCGYSVDNRDLEILIKEQPQLQEIYIDYELISTNVLTLIKGLKDLKFLKFTVNNHEVYTEIVRKLSPEWFYYYLYSLQVHIMTIQRIKI